MQQKKHIEINKTEDCCGCRSCEQICPQHCISMQENEEGFRYPVVDESRCVNCGLCVSRCPWIEKPAIRIKLDKSIAYAARIKDDSILKRSSSGGVFSALALLALKNGGVVCGCAFDDKLIAKHIFVTDEKELARLRGSKYVASDTNTVYKETQTFLKQGRFVLFSGTPCQIAGLIKFLNKDYENLLTVEILCHGTPSQKLFGKYIDWLSEKRGKSILEYRFRDKSKGWGYLARTEDFPIQADVDPYYASFLRGKTYRYSCYACHYANINRCADITLGDFWGVEVFHPDFYSSKGASCVLLNTENALAFWAKVKEYLEYVDSGVEKISMRNYNLVKPTIMPKCRKFIYNGIDYLSFEEYASKIKLRGNEYLFALIKNHIPKCIRIRLNRVRFFFKGRRT
ncbi:MAG: Coenzyme F420 hydrogenase/dehydrogenase, beta subunit C-terminal domain [Fibrobacteraceae bacterium]|nr:Coenzyme F420 hydrogenase/dehydrogenase, beta subunit C-terminal domain [Fibrobacteraceae bacterium]